VSRHTALSIYGSRVKYRVSVLAAAMAFALLIVPGRHELVAEAQAQAQAQDSAQCPEGDDWIECMAASGDRAAIYRVGRTAYEQARVSGDFSEALRLARSLNGQNDRNGARLLKMVHLQLGWGGHKDYVQAYVWLNEDLRDGIDYLDKWVATLAEKMTPEQVAEANRRLEQR
jgi:hypothetical protein